MTIVALPDRVEAGALVPPNEVLDKTLICVDPGRDAVSESARRVLNLFGSELVAELDEMERQTLATGGLGT